MLKALTLIALVASAIAGPALAEPTYKADVPDSILTPNEVQTRLGTLRFFDGAPDAETVKLERNPISLDRSRRR